MIDSPLYLLAIFVVGIGLAVLGFFMREGVVTSNIYKQGVKLYQEKDYKGAQAAFRQVISRHPSNDVVRLLLGDVLVQQDKLEEAIAQFKELIDLAPKNVDAYLRLGMLLVKQDKLEEAIATLETARDLFKAQRQNQKAETVEQLLQEISTQQSLT
jgi:TolA-binding protein